MKLVVLCCMKFLITLLAILYISSQALAANVKTPCGFIIEEGFSPEQLFILQSDLSYLINMKGGKASSLHKLFFGSDKVSGAAYCGFLSQRMSKLYFKPHYERKALSFNYDYQGQVAVMESYFRQSQIDRLSTLIHEARHTADIQTAHHICPQGVEGMESCDSRYDGSYGYEYVWYEAIILHCQNCTIEEKKAALKGAKLVLNRIDQPESKLKLIVK